MGFSGVRDARPGQAAFEDEVGRPGQMSSLERAMAIGWSPYVTGSSKERHSRVYSEQVGGRLTTIKCHRIGAHAGQHIVRCKRPTDRVEFRLVVPRTDPGTMNEIVLATLKRGLTILVGLLIVKVTAGIVLNYRLYFPPDFNSEFLHGRNAYFAGSYQWAFYSHIVSGPITLLLGMLLISERFRLSFPAWHRTLGRIQGVGVLVVVAPSGLWMAFRADGGPIAIAGFATVALVTGTCVALGWRSAVKQRFAEHRRWMWRCYLLLCSAIVLRLIAGLATVTGVQGGWVYPFSAWASWLLPLAVFEFSGASNRSVRRSLSKPAPTARK
jgi:Predicted membrane protein (DUF2306)